MTVIGGIVVLFSSPDCSCMEYMASQTEENRMMVLTAKATKMDLGPYRIKKSKEIDVVKAIALCE